MLIDLYAESHIFIVMLSVIVPIVIMLSVLAPFKCLFSTKVQIQPLFLEQTALSSLLRLALALCLVFIHGSYVFWSNTI
jgi:hypothetical protein